MQAALGRLDGVQSAKLAKGRSFFEVKVLEGKPLLPSQIAKAIPRPFALRSLTVTDLAGEIQKTGDGLLLTARGSHRKFILQADDAIRKRLDEGSLKIAVSGRLEEPQAKNGEEAPLPVIHVAEIREVGR